MLLVLKRKIHKVTEKTLAAQEFYFKIEFSLD